MNGNEKWISCGSLLDKGLKGFELFRLFKQGRLHPHDPDNGFKIIELSSVEEKPAKSYEEVLKAEKAANLRCKDSEDINNGVVLDGAILVKKERGGRRIYFKPFLDGGKDLKRPWPMKLVEVIAKKKYKNLPMVRKLPAGSRAATFSLSENPKYARSKIKDARSWLVQLQEVMEIEDLRRLLGDDRERSPIVSSVSNTLQKKPDSNSLQKKQKKEPQLKKYPNHVIPIRTGDDIQWADVIITFINDYEILVQFGKESVDRKFNNAGFENRKNGKPINAWIVFCEAASNKDRCIPFAFENRKNVEKVAQTLNEKFSMLFSNMCERPVQLTKDKNSYQFAFQLESKI